VASVWPPGPDGFLALALAVYSQPGDLVCDPDCGSGAVVVAAVRAGRHAVGVAPNPDRWQGARAALTAAKAAGAPGDGTILDRLPDRESWTGPGPADLLLTTIGPSTDPADPSGLLDARLRTRLTGYRDLVRPAGRLVVIADYHIDDGLDLASRIAVAGQRAGWRSVDRLVALTLPASRTLGPRPAAGRARPAHVELLVFRHGAPAGPPPPQADPAPACALAVPPALAAGRRAA